VRYSEQQDYLDGSRLWAAAAAALVCVFAAICLRTSPRVRLLFAIEFVLVAIALAISIYYTPDYLHLTVTPNKPMRWLVKVRWRIIAAAFVLGVLAISSMTDFLVLAAALVWLLAANFMANKFGNGQPALYFSARDLTLVAVLLFAGQLNLLAATVIVAAAAHLSVVVARQSPMRWAIFNSSFGCFILVGGFWRRYYDPKFLVAACGLVVASSLGTALLVRRAQRQHTRNMRAALQELIDFTGYSEERIRELWANSNQDLAKNWNAAPPPESDPVRLAEWYRQNSELYLFAISAYNLEYKRIRSNLKVLRYARGASLDYGAGNGEIVLDLARRGQPAAYYDVEGVTMSFARKRAAEQSLDVQFFCAKQELAAASVIRGFDTVFSFDVLEHLPDLQGELTFLASLLNPGGLLVFDVPAGSTKAHPMHLNHHLNVVSFLTAKGLKDERGWLQKLPFRKEEKFFFRAPSSQRPATGLALHPENQSRMSSTHRAG
jgi:2-polyprenyl-3-methyl-5-hydroxy-6-metoxy-1,4-benzoquinol methylase